MEDSGGSGKNRGGLGIERIFTIQCPEVTVSAIFNRSKRSLGERTTDELERQEIEAYLRQPVTPGEFDLWENKERYSIATRLPMPRRF